MEFKKQSHLKLNLLFLITISLMFLLLGCGDKHIDKDQYIDEHFQEYQLYLEKKLSLETFAFQHAVKIQVEVSESKTIFGSGVIVDTEDTYIYILTNYHLVYDTLHHDKILMIDHEGVKRQVTFVYGHASYDLAILVFEQDTHDYEALSILDTEIISPYGTYIAGYPKGEGYQFTYANFSQEKRVELKGDVGDVIDVTFDIMSLDIKSESGSSGSAVYNLDKELIGIVFAGSNSILEPFETYVIPSTLLIEFINLYEQ